MQDTVEKSSTSATQHTRVPGNPSIANYHWREGRKRASIFTRDYDSKIQVPDLIITRCEVLDQRKVVENPLAAQTQSLINLGTDLLVMSGRAPHHDMTGYPEMSRKYRDKPSESRQSILPWFEYCKCVAGDPGDTRNYEQWTNDQNKSAQTGAGVKGIEREAARSSDTNTTVEGKVDP